MKADVVYDYYTAWAKEFDKEMYDLVTSNEKMSKEIFNIDKEGPKPRKDFAKWDEVRGKVDYFFDELFDKETAENVELPKTLSLENAKEIIKVYKDKFNFNSGSQENWFEEFKGMISDVAGAVRAALSHRSNTPDLYTIMQILGEDKVRSRFENFLNL